MKSIRAGFFVFVGLIAFSFISYAGMGETCPMHKEDMSAKKAVIMEASEALKTSNPELSKKLEDLCKDCCAPATPAVPVV